jgi:hypothetical protein
VASNSSTITATLDTVTSQVRVTRNPSPEPVGAVTVTVLDSNIFSSPRVSRTLTVNVTGTCP